MVAPLYTSRPTCEFFDTRKFSFKDLILQQALRRALDADPFDNGTLQLIETLIRFPRRESIAVNFYQRGFLLTKSYLLTHKVLR